MSTLPHASGAPARHRSYDEALAACPQGAYEAEELVRVVVEKTRIAQARIQQSRMLDAGAWRTVMAAGMAQHSGVLNVLDFGGAAGYHHAIAQLALSERVELRWCVVETPTMARLASPLAQPGLEFFDDVVAAAGALGRVDLVFTSSALQYCPDPLHTLTQLLNVGADKFFLTRTPLAEGDETVVTTQTSMLGANGPGPLPPGHTDKAISYPVSYVPRTRVEALIRQRYSIRFGMVEDGATLFSGGNAVNAHFGYLADRLPDQKGAL